MFSGPPSALHWDCMVCIENQQMYKQTNKSLEKNCENVGEIRYVLEDGKMISLKLRFSEKDTKS